MNFNNSVCVRCGIFKESDKKAQWANVSIAVPNPIPFASERLTFFVAFMYTFRFLALQLHLKRFARRIHLWFHESPYAERNWRLKFGSDAPLRSELIRQTLKLFRFVWSEKWIPRERSTKSLTLPKKKREWVCVLRAGVSVYLYRVELFLAHFLAPATSWSIARISALRRKKIRIWLIRRPDGCVAFKPRRLTTCM